MTSKTKKTNKHLHLVTVTMDLEGILGNISYHLFEVWPWKVLVLHFTLPFYQCQNLDTLCLNLNT